MADYFVQKLVLGIALPKEIFYEKEEKLVTKFGVSIVVAYDSPKFNWVQLHDFNLDALEFVYEEDCSHVFVGRILHTDSSLSAQYCIRATPVDLQPDLFAIVKEELDNLFELLQLEMLLPEVQLHIISIPVYN